jgi:O-antigen ligase
MLYTLLVLFATVTCAQGVLTATSAKDLIHFNLFVVTLFALISAIYAAESLLSLGLRSPTASSIDPIFGIQRVKGPMYGASTGYFMTIPPLSLFFQRLLTTRQRRLPYILLSLVLIIALLGTGSRGAVVTMAVFVLLALPSLRDPLRQMRLSLLLVAPLLTGALVVFSVASLMRPLTFQDVHREAFHAQALAIVLDRTPTQNAFGEGYGSHWPWYRLDSYVRQDIGRLAVSTAAGPLSAEKRGHHPHSLLIVLAIELGLPGLCYLGLLLSRAALVHHRLVARRSAVVWACGFLATAPGLFFDLHLFYYAPNYLVWWLSAFSLERLSCSRKTPLVMPHAKHPNLRAAPSWRPPG